MTCVKTRPIKFPPLSQVPCAPSLLHFFIPTPQRRAFAFASRSSNRYHVHPIVELRKESQGSCPPRVHRLHDLDSDRRPHSAILAYLFQPVSPPPILCDPERVISCSLHAWIILVPLRWWWLHWFINFFISAPIVYAALAMAVSANHLSQYPIDHHKVAFLPYCHTEC